MRRNSRLSVGANFNRLLDGQILMDPFSTVQRALGLQRAPGLVASHWGAEIASPLFKAMGEFIGAMQVPTGALLFLLLRGVALLDREVGKDLWRLQVLAQVGGAPAQADRRCLVPSASRPRTPCNRLAAINQRTSFDAATWKCDVPISMSDGKTISCPN